MSIRKEKIKVYNMTCASCETRVENEVKKLNGILSIKASYSGQYAEIEYDDDICSIIKIKRTISDAGYSTKSSNDYKFIGILILVSAVVILGFNTSSFDMEAKLNNASYVVLFLVGVFTSIHCVGMCGGIMLSQSISKANVSKLEAIKPALLYNMGRVVSYTALGAIVGIIGSAFSLSFTTKAAMQIIAGIFMIIMGFNLSGFSLFRKLQIKLPNSFCKRKTNGSPFIVGILNGLMPCGPLQTMQIFALSTGNAARGALSMFMFSIGTVPLMVTFGALSGLLSKGYTKKILKMSGVLVILLGLIMGNRGLAILGININPITALALSNNKENNIIKNPYVAKATLEDGVQIINMTADNKGFTPNSFYVQKGIPVKWIIDGKEMNTCNNAIIIPSLKKEFNIKKGENIIEFTPNDSDINFSCWMGMIRGVIKVVDNLDLVDTSKVDESLPPPSTGPSCCARPIEDTQNKPSIYGNNFSLIPTEMLVGKTTEGSFTFKGIGYEFQPLIAVSAKNEKTKFIFDLRDFDNALSEYFIIDGVTGEIITSFTGVKGINEVEFISTKTGFYGIIKGETVLGLIEVVEDINAVDLDEIRVKFLQ